MNYNHFHYYSGLWGGTWSAVLAKSTVSDDEKIQLLSVVNALAEAFSLTIGKYTDTTKLTEEYMSNLPFPTLFTRVPVTDCFLLVALLGDERYLKPVMEVYGKDYEQTHYAVFAENVSHLNVISKTVLPNDEALKDIIKLVNESCSTNSVKGRVVTSSIVGVLLEWYAWELQLQKLAKRVINDDGYYEFVDYDDPRPMDIDAWELTNGKR